MIVSLNWLKNYIDLSDVSVDDVVEKLTITGLEVDEVIDQSKLFDNIVVGYVKEKKKHPNADRLSVCLVNDGNEDLQVVCGAPNVETGQKVVFGKVGAVIPNGNFKLTKAKIRGEKSFGMICAEDELGLSDDHDGIMVLDESLEPGTKISDALNLNDVILDIAITPNRADALSNLGIARDLSAIYNKPVSLPEINVVENSNENINDVASVEIEDTERCPRYVARVIKNITVKESPAWLKSKLESIGLRPINNIVDVTNFVLHEYGQPLHAFDMDKLTDNKIIVKTANKDDKFTTLDSKERKLADTDLMICDAAGMVAVAGVMGGENSEVSNETKNVLLESAYFDPSSIRKTAKKLGLQTDASYRFERGCDYDIVLTAADRAISLFAELAGGEVVKGTIDNYPNEIPKTTVEIRIDRIKKVMGFEVDLKTTSEILTNLQFGVTKIDDNKLSVVVPSFRGDVEREIDLIEEVARIYGFDSIPPVERVAVTLDAKVDQSNFVNNLRNKLVEMNFNEVVTNSLLNSETASKFGNSIAVMNPQTVEMSNLRPSLLPGVLNTVSKNIKVREQNLRLYEIGHVFNRLNNEKLDSFDDFDESEMLTLVITGKAKTDEWFQKEENYDIYDMKGTVEDIFERMGIKTFKYNYELENELCEYGFELKVKNEAVGFGGKLNKAVLKQFDINTELFVLELNLSKLRTEEHLVKSFDELLKFPKMIKDIAFIVDKNIEANEVKKQIERGSTKLLKNIKLFDIFEQESLGTDKKSLAFQLEYFDSARTLTEEEVEKDFWKAINFVKEKLDAKLRGE